MGKGNPRVYIDVTIGNRVGGKVVFELYKDITPKTVENFIALLTGRIGVGQHTKKALHYVGSKVFRIEQGVALCAGDIENKSGRGGESIFGQTFRDENYVRRHTQAGVLSMWTPKGRHTNASSFLVTLKACRRFDGRYVAFGQVVSGMDVIRAIEKVPVQGDFVPRVEVIISGCGIHDVEEAATVKDDVLAGGSIEPVKYGKNKPMNLRESTKAMSILSGKTLQDVAAQKLGSECDDDAKLATGPQTFKNDVEKRIYELRMKMNKGRQANTVAVLEEKKRFEDPEYEKKKAAKEWKDRQEKKAQQEEEEGETAAVNVPKGKEYLAEPADKSRLKTKKEDKKEQSKGVFGWDVFNQDSLLRSHEKNLSKVEFSADAYSKQKDSIGESSFYAGHESATPIAFKATEEAKERIAESMQDAADRRKKFSRRRAQYEDEDISGINERNRHFNKKIQRAFGEYTNEYKQNLERGTAL
eukprot:GEMP01047152.1.p1 GENE.GEMP01047152.1~~GEMP01047152.1.p1  ORF type:complete len:471 (+),score=114.02 GEMP01047152.1:95-1507(+)